MTGVKSESSLLLCGWSKSKGEGCRVILERLTPWGQRSRCSLFRGSREMIFTIYLPTPSVVHIVMRIPPFEQDYWRTKQPFKISTDLTSVKFSQCATHEVSTYIYWAHYWCRVCINLIANKFVAKKLHHTSIECLDKNPQPQDNQLLSGYIGKCIFSACERDCAKLAN